MATYVSNTFTQLAPAAVNGSRSFNTPAGATANDRLVAVVKVNKVGGGAVPSVSSLPTDWSELSSDWQDDINHSYDSAMIVISGMHDGSSSSYSVTISDASGTTEGGNITCFAYSSAQTIEETSTVNDTVAQLSHTGPTQTAAADESCIAIIGCPASTNTTAWDAPFTERTDNEYYGLVSVADANGAATLTPTCTLSTTGLSALWTMIRVSEAASTASIAWTTA